MRKSLLPLFLLLYLGLLLVSNWVAKHEAEQTEPRAGQAVLQTPHGELAWMKKVATPRGDQPVAVDPAEPKSSVLFLHAPNRSSESMNSLADLIQRPALIPDLLGSGGSRLALPSLANAAQVGAIQSLLAQELGASQEAASRVHLVCEASSLSYGLDLIEWIEVFEHTAETSRIQVASLTLIRPIGTQSTYLLGDHQLNKALEGAGLFLAWGLDKLTPHFGKFQRSSMSRYGWRRNYENDLSRVGAGLSELEIPCLVITKPKPKVKEGKVSLGVKESLRLIPQASSGVGRESMGPFWDQVDAGQGLTRGQASAERLARANDPQAPQTSRRFSGTKLIWVILLLVLAMQTSEDLTCIGAGLMVWKGVIGFFPAVFACWLGIVLGDTGLYLLGRIFGPPALKYPPLKWMVKPAQVERQSKKAAKHMGRIVVASRFMPGARVPVYVGLGIIKADLKRFVLFLMIAGALWTPILVGLSALFGKTFMHWFESNQRLALLGLLGMVVFLWLLIKKVLPLATWRGRRLALGAIRRKTQWEFWPRSWFYPPIVLTILGLVLRRGGIRNLLLTNPGMQNGGLVREQKSEIFKGLEGCGSPLPPWTLLKGTDSPEARFEQLQVWREQHAVTGEIVLKPDIGYRGVAVRFANTEAEAFGILQACDGDLVVQPKLPGQEFGLFYARLPNEKSGRIISITEKKLPSLVGDGVHTLEQLILRDERAVCMAKTYFANLTHRLDDIPALGEKIRLANIGSHSRGAIFLDGAAYKTPELEKEIDRISQHYEGFYFGRYDMLVDSIDDLKAGRDLRIVELNGLTSESTHIYDPKHRLAYGRKTIRDQWRMAFEIAEQNVAKGHQRISVAAFCRLIWSFLREPTTVPADD